MIRVSLSRSVNSPRLDTAALDKGTGDLHEKINTVYETLGLDDTTACHKIEEPENVKATFSAREEAVLRWLLGALGGSGAQHSKQVYAESHCCDFASLTFDPITFRLRLDPRSWHLTSYLIQRIPIANTALLLNSLKFLQVLDSTLHDATDEKRLGSGAGRVAVQDETACQSSIISDIRGNSSSEKSESSRTITGSPMSVSVSSPRERKGQRLPTAIHDTPKERSRGDSDIERLFSSILLVLECIFALTMTPDTEGKKSATADYSRVHMKAALRGKPDIASRILGAWFRMVLIVTSSSKGNLDSYSIHMKDSCLNAVIQIWQNRSLGPDETPNHVSKAFSTNCLVPGLLLLSKFTSMPKKSKMIVDGIRSIESLLAHHILLPARVSLLGLGTASAAIAKEETDWRMPLLADLLEPLQLEASRAYETSRFINPCGENWTAISRAITLFFGLAVRCSTNNREKRWSIDTLWIEKVLITFAASVGLAVPPSTTAAIQPAKVDLLEQMLQVAIQDKISINSDNLRSVVINSSSLLSGANEDMRWKLLEKFSRLDEEFFYTFVEADNKFLHSLLARITSITVPEPAKGDLEDNYSVAKTILTRLLQAFNRARNITRFMSHWHRVLEIAERERLCSSTSDAPRSIGFSMWEDEDLIMETGRMLGKSLTLKQTKEVLVSSEFNIAQLLNRPSDPEADIRAFASLVILDAVLSSIGQDRNVTLDMVEENIRSIYGTLIQSASHSSCLRSHRWRIWRAISQIQEFGRVTATTTPPNLGPDSKLSNVCKVVGQGMHMLHKTALENAQSSLERGFPGMKQSRMGPQCYLEALIAFDFILQKAQGSITAIQAGESASTEATTTVILNRSVEFLVLCLPRLAAARVGHEIPVWNGKLRGITGEQALGVALTARLTVYYSGVLLQVPSATRTRLFLLIHELASLSSQNREQCNSRTHQVSFVRIWDGILSNENLLYYTKLKDELVGVLSESLCVGRSGIITPSAEGSNVKASAVLGLTKLPLEVFRREQRKRILNVLTEDIFRTRAECNLPIDSLSDQISLILKLMDVPNASATLATDPKVLWNLSKVIGQSGLCPTTLAFRGFGEIVKKNLRHLILTKDQERSDRYLRSFSESLHGHLSNISSLGNSVGTLQLITSSLLILWPHLEALSGDTVGILQDTRRKYFRLLLSDLTEWKQRLGYGHASAGPFLEALIDAVIGFPGLGSTTNGDDTVRDAVLPIYPSLLQLPDENSEKEPDSASKTPNLDSLTATSSSNPLNKAIYSAWFGAYLLKLGGKVADLSGRTSIENPGLAHPGREFLYSTFHSFAISLKQADKLSLLLYLEKVACQGFAFSEECYMLILRALVVSDGNADTQSQTADISKVLSVLYSKLCLNLSQAREFRRFRLVIDTMGLIASKKVRLGPNTSTKLS
ncbi:hypothetical protein GP486_000066 [Trichoglossum hirsutum]|uniref:Nucleolar 27S pre-rRNA processing Urb2/Npa2 C-terminal domain-containing protein n=1 Tax=Trichoglossum hirsutum TaxID=265104 RepID=A0A9P8LJG2_9PEZI|nr:hypothetical protein GP486_000066 [Trichoglossum hirsutum]